LLKNIL